MSYLNGIFTFSILGLLIWSVVSAAIFFIVFLYVCVELGLIDIND